jgi:hypothetical protein
MLALLSVFRIPVDVSRNTGDAWSKNSVDVVVGGRSVASSDFEWSLFAAVRLAVKGSHVAGSVSFGSNVTGLCAANCEARSKSTILTGRGMSRNTEHGSNQCAGIPGYGKRECSPCAGIPVLRESENRGLLLRRYTGREKIKALFKERPP